MQSDRKSASSASVIRAVSVMFVEVAFMLRSRSECGGGVRARGSGGEMLPELASKMRR